MNNKFTKPPLSKIEKEKKAEDFLNFSNDKNSEHIYEVPKNATERVMKKESTKRITMRLPESLAYDITEISALTGLSMNSVGLELLRASAKQKLKELKN